MFNHSGSRFRANRNFAGASDDLSASADSVVPILLGKSGQQAPAVGGAAQEHVHQVQGLLWMNSSLSLLWRHAVGNTQAG